MDAGALEFREVLAQALQDSPGPFVDSQGESSTVDGLGEGARPRTGPGEGTNLIRRSPAPSPGPHPAMTMKKSSRFQVSPR